MATEKLARFSPFLTQANGLDAKIVDRNLLAIKKALDDANATITRQQTLINRIIAGDVNINITGPAGPAGMPGMDADESAGDAFALPGPPGARGRSGRDGRDGADGEDGEPGTPGPPGARGRDGASGIWMPGGDEDVAEPPPLWTPAPKAPFVLALGYGPDNFSGTLPTLAESLPHFWLHPYTSMDNVSAISVGSSNDLGIIEWEVGGSYTMAELDFYVRTCGLSSGGGGGPLDLTVAVSKNGTDTACSTTIASTETDQRHRVVPVQVSFADTDRVGIHITAGSDYGSGNLIAHFIARLT